MYLWYMYRFVAMVERWLIPFSFANLNESPGISIFNFWTRKRTTQSSGLHTHIVVANSFLNSGFFLCCHQMRREKKRSFSLFLSFAQYDFHPIPPLFLSFSIPHVNLRAIGPISICPRFLNIFRDAWKLASKWEVCSVLWLAIEFELELEPLPLGHWLREAHIEKIYIIMIWMKIFQSSMK